jgi:hypothetical protein
LDFANHTIALAGAISVVPGPSTTTTEFFDRINRGGMTKPHKKLTLPFTSLLQAWNNELTKQAESDRGRKFISLRLLRALATHKTLSGVFCKQINDICISAGLVIPANVITAAYGTIVTLVHNAKFNDSAFFKGLTRTDDITGISQRARIGAKSAVTIPTNPCITHNADSSSNTTHKNSNGRTTVTTAIETHRRSKNTGKHTTGRKDSNKRQHSQVPAGTRRSRRKRQKKRSLSKNNCPHAECGLGTEDPMICCDRCNQWHHQECFDVKSSALKLDKWFCCKCNGTTAARVEVT